MFSRPGPAHLHIEAPGRRPLRLALETSRAQRAGAGAQTSKTRPGDLYGPTAQDRPLRLNLETSTAQGPKTDL